MTCQANPTLLRLEACFCTSNLPCTSISAYALNSHNISPDEVMADYLVLSAEQRDALENIISNASKPARWPHFPQLSADGEWTQWTADPDLPDDEPSTVEQPSWAKRPIGSESVPRHVRSFQHDNLSKGHIRLLKLTNVHFDEQSNLLHGFEQICVPLHAAPEYQALSYCWGNMQLCTGILFTHADGCQRVFRITEDLATCLYMIYQSKAYIQRPTSGLTRSA
jgi:hypothetical protein